MSRIVGTGMPPAGQVDFVKVDSTIVNLGAGLDHFTIVSTDLGVSTTINSGAGADTIDVRSIAGPTTINAGAGIDLIRAGSQWGLDEHARHRRWLHRAVLREWRREQRGAARR